MMDQLYTQTAIKRKVYQLAESIEKQATASLHVHVILDGAFMFASDFIRVYGGKVSRVTFLPISRGYGSGRVHPPRLVFKWPRYTRDLTPHYTHLILDVCVEKGETLKFVKRYLYTGMPVFNQMITCALVANGREGLSVVDHVGFICTKNVFLTGYGMGPYRDFGAIYGIPK